MAKLDRCSMNRHREVYDGDAGHAAKLHQPAHFNQAVETFLAKLPAA